MRDQSFVQVENMIHRPDFLKHDRCDGNLNHEVLIAVKHLNLDVLEQEVIERSTPGSPKYQKWMTFEEVYFNKTNFFN